MTSNLAKNSVDHEYTLGNRCPAGSHIQAEAATVPNVHESVASKSALKNILSTDNPQNTAGAGDTYYGHLNDLAYAAEHARIEARKKHKRFTDAIYARRRRQREKEDEKELIREAEHSHKVNKKLREENNELQAMLSRAIAEIEAMGDTEKEWLHNVIEKSKEAISVPPTKTKIESTDQSKSNSMKGLSKNNESISKPTIDSIDVDTHMRSPCQNAEIESTNVEETATIPASSRPLNEKSDSIEIAPVERNGNDIPQNTDTQVIEALQQASYLQGLQDAVLLNRAATHSHPQQPQSSPLLPSTTNQAAVMQSIMPNDTFNQRAIEQLLLVNRINALSRHPDSLALHPELSSLLDPHYLLRNSHNPTSDLLLRNISAAIGYPVNPNMVSALAGLRNINLPPSLPSTLTAAQILAINNAASAYQAQMQLGLLNTYSDRTNVLTSLLQHHQMQEQQISLLTQLQQQQQQQQSTPANSSSLMPLSPDELQRRNLPP